MNYYIKEEKKSNPKRDALFSVFVFLGVFLLVFLISSAGSRNPQELTSNISQTEEIIDAEETAGEDILEEETADDLVEDDTQREEVVEDEKEEEEVVPAEKEKEVAVVQEKENRESEKVSYQNTVTATQEQEKEIGQATTNDEEDRTKEKQAVSYYTETAQRGDGLTHIARRVILTYITSEEAELSAEQVVYAEDYLQKRLQEERDEEIVLLGEDVAVSYQLVENAVEMANNLTQDQISNLKQFTPITL